ncbi:hypothetical protein NKH99_07980 [Mesorhizobium sp. M0854]|uniref:hypothetical protein n=1 Tax=Mesorhizobium sp. M0854 TaxID=2957013 RepID=UPI00333D27D6
MAMVLHQAHYFSYCYAMPLLLARADLGNTPLVGFWFACGWVSYLSAEAVWHCYPPRTVFVVGHIGLVPLLGLLSYLSDVSLGVLLLWVLSGLGGGTVYSLALVQKANRHSHERLEQAEDIGHIVGVITALAGVLLLHLNEAVLPMIGSILAAFAAMTVFIFVPARRNACTRVQSTAAGGKNAGE